MNREPDGQLDAQSQADGVDLVIPSREQDLGGFTVRRSLPYRKRRTVGPYVFFDHMGPARMPAGQGIDVLPHPHIGLATVTYLFEGEILHRDSLGCVQPITPGAVNLMTAGRGIVHSERTAPDLRQQDKTLHGIQLWLALPAALEECDPAFVHYPANAIPVATGPDARVTVIIGEAFGAVSPVTVPSPTLYAELLFDGQGRVPVPENYAERAVYSVDGEILVGGAQLSPGAMAVLQPGAAVSVQAAGPARAMLIGGAPLPEKRTIWWNFVSTSRERIEQAKRDWRDRRFEPVPGETEWTPLPD